MSIGTPLTLRNAILLSALIGLLLICLPACSNLPTHASLDKSVSAPIIPNLQITDNAYLVSRIVDGDTVVIDINGNQTKVRLIGVDTPETVHPSKPVEVYGKEASTFLANLLKGEKVYVEYEKETQELDKYGRLLAYLYRAPDKLFINLEIIRQGYGHAYIKYPFKYMDTFRDTERQARESGKGLWSPDVAVKEPANTEPKPTQVTDSQKETKQDTVETTVYVTKSGSKYHRAGCKYLAKSCIPMSLKEAKTRYGPCSVCNPPR